MWWNVIFHEKTLKFNILVFTFSFKNYDITYLFYTWNKSSPSFSRTSAGILCCFWGMFDTSRGPCKIQVLVHFCHKTQNILNMKNIFEGNVTIKLSVGRQQYQTSSEKNIKFPTWEVRMGVRERRRMGVRGRKGKNKTVGCWMYLKAAAVEEGFFKFFCKGLSSVFF